MLASRTADERPAKPVPMLLALCSLMASPLARTEVDAAASATATADFRQCGLIMQNSKIIKAADGSKYVALRPATVELYRQASSAEVRSIRLSSTKWLHLGLGAPERATRMEAGDQFSQCPNTLSMRSTEQNQHDLSGSQCIGGGMVPLRCCHRSETRAGERIPHFRAKRMSVSRTGFMTMVTA